MNKIVLIPVLMALVIYIVIFQTIPSVNKVLDLREQRVEKIKDINDQKDKLAKLEKFQNEVVKHQEQFDFVSKFIPVDPIENDIINFLNQKAKDNEVDLFNINSADRVTKKRKDNNGTNINFSEVEITLTGSYDNIRNFLSEIFIINRLYSFDTIMIEKIVVKDGEISPDSLNVKIVFNYSYVPDFLVMKTSDIGRVSSDEGVKKVMILLILS